MFIRESLKKRHGKKKKKNEQNRLRNKIVNFRTTLEEREKIESRIALSGLHKQDYFIQNCLYGKVICYGNVRVFEEIRKQLQMIFDQLSGVTISDDISSDTLENLRMILELYLNLNFKEKKEQIKVIYGEQQSAEIATIKNRPITLKLSDADVKRIWEKAGQSNLTVSELLENFIGDLVDGTYSNGSDERQLADDWYNRCGFSQFPQYTFLHYLLIWQMMDDVAMNWEIYTSIKEDFCHPNDLSEDEIAGLQEDMQMAYEAVEEEYSEYKKHDKDNVSKSLEEEMKIVMEWKKNRDQMLR